MRDAALPAGSSARTVLSENGWIPDCEVVELRESRLREILVPDAGVRVEEFGDPGGRWIHFDAGQCELAARASGDSAKKQARPATWLEDAPAVETHPAERPPDGADHELRRVVGVLGGPLEVGEVVARDEPFEFDAEIFPCRRESVSGAAEDPVGEVGRAERGEARQPLLLVGPCMAASASIVVMSWIAARLSSARAFQPSARRRSPASR